MKKRQGLIGLICFLIVISLIPPIYGNVTERPHATSLPCAIDDVSIGDAGTEYWALLVAAGVYAEFPDVNIPFMLDQIDNLYTTLLTSPTWSADHIKVIKGENATLKNIIQGLRWLDRMEDSDDVSLVYIATHGTVLPMDLPPKDEADGYDEALVPYWGFVYPTTLLWDDELNFFLSRLESQGVCLIVNSCFSGGFNDPPLGHRIRHPLSTRDDTQGSSIQTALKWQDEFAEEVKGQGRVVIMSSQESELSYDESIGPFIIDGLRGYADNNTDGVVSAEELFSYVQPRGLIWWQHPSVYDGYEGELPLLQVASQQHCFVDHTQQRRDLWGELRKNHSPPTSPLSLGDNTVYGYVTDAQTHAPVECYLELSWYGGCGNYSFMHTETDPNGQYSFHSSDGYFSIYAYNSLYLQTTTAFYAISDNEVVWVNISLELIPVENSVLCSYVTDAKTQEPLPQTYVSALWTNGHGGFYTASNKTDDNGYLFLPIAAGEVYLYAGHEGYIFSFFYRTDVREGQATWANLSLNRDLPQVDIIKPLCALYKDSNRTIPFLKPIIFRAIEVQAFVHDYWYSPAPATKVEFYLDGKLKETDTTEPYTWMWDEQFILRTKHTLKVIAYNDAGNTSSDELIVWKFF